MISVTAINIYEGYRLMYNYQSYHTYNFFHLISRILHLGPGKCVTCPGLPIHFKNRENQKPVFYIYSEFLLDSY